MNRFSCDGVTAGLENAKSKQQHVNLVISARSARLGVFFVCFTTILGLTLRVYCSTSYQYIKNENRGAVPLMNRIASSMATIVRWAGWMGP